MQGNIRFVMCETLNSFFDADERDHMVVKECPMPREWGGIPIVARTDVEFDIIRQSLPEWDVRRVSPQEYGNAAQAGDRFLIMLVRPTGQFVLMYATHDTVRAREQRERGTAPVHGFCVGFTPHPDYAVPTQEVAESAPLGVSRYVMPYSWDLMAAIARGE